MRKHERECLRICRKAGLIVLSISYGKHLKFECQQGTIVFPKTPSDRRSLKNMASVARKIANDTYATPA